MKTLRRGKTRFSAARFVNDEDGRIVRWNKAAEKILGYREPDVLGRNCHDVVCGRDIFGNRFCLPSCTLFGMTSHDQPVHDFVLDMQTAAGETVRATLRVSSYHKRRSGRRLIEHVMTLAH